MDPLIFSEAEAHERFNFHMFYENTFVTMKKNTPHFISGLDADMLFSIFKTRYPNTELSADIIRHILVFGGYMDNSEGRVYCAIRKETFSAWPKETQKYILNYADYANTFDFRQMMIEDAGLVSPFGDIVDEGVKLFMWNQLYWRNFKYYHAMPIRFRKAPQGAIYRHYQSYCLKRGYKPATQAQLIDAIVKKGGVKAKGYYNGVAGLNVFTNVFIPFTPEDSIWSIEEGVAVITLDGKQIFNDGRLVQNFSEDGLTAYLNSRLELNHEPRTTQEEEIKVYTDTGTKTKSPAQIIPRGKTKSKAATSNTDNDGCGEDANSGSILPVTSNQGDEIPVRVDTSSIRESECASDTVTDTSTDVSTSSSDVDNHCEEEPDLIDEAESNTTGTEDPAGMPTADEIVKQLVMLCTMFPASVAKKDIQTYLISMQQEFPEIGDVQDYWDLLQVALKEQ